MDIYKMREMKNAIRRIESTSKVTGTAQYLDDLEMQGMAYGGIIRSPYPHAKVLSIDFSEAKKMPGVLGTLTPDDVPQVHFNVTGSLKNPSLIEDQSILTWHPLHEGDRICAVVAEDKETLHRALEAVKIEYEVLPASMTIDQSIKEGARIINPEFYQDNFYFRRHLPHPDAAPDPNGARFLYRLLEPRQQAPHLGYEPSPLSGSPYPCRAVWHSRK